MASSELTPLLDEIRSRLKLSDLIERTTKVFRKGRTVKALCPFHNEKTPSFSIDDDRGLYHCFGCNASGDHFSFVKETQNLGFTEAIQMLAEQLGLEMPKKEISTTTNKSTGLIEALEAACIWYQEQLQRSTGEVARNYLDGRQINQASINLFRLGYAPSSGLANHLKTKGFSTSIIMEAGLVLKADDGRIYDRFRSRIVFPIINPKNQVIAFGGRILDKGEPKYLNSPESQVFQKRYVLYGISQARKHLRGKAIVVEGYMDVIRLHQEGLGHAVAPLGTAIGIEHIQQLWRFATCPVIAFDGDTAGEKAALSIVDKILPFLNANNSLKVMFLPKGEDPDSFVKNAGKIAFEKLADNPHPIYELLWQETTKNFKLDQLSPEEFLQIKAIIKTQLQRIENNDLRQAYFRQFDQLLFRFEKQKSTQPKKRSLALPILTNDICEKILLVTLINHPYLWEDVGENLMGISFKDPLFETYRQELIDYFANEIHNESASSSLPEKLVYLQKISDEGFYSRVPFAKIGYDQETAKIGWLEAFNKLCNQQLLQNDQKQSAQHLKDDFNLSNWQRLKAIKQTLT
ncbi:MAG: DNA primase [Proteobacteria bacterium]|nr:DNA primase [Pseudomonadota bacterium]